MASCKTYHQLEIYCNTHSIEQSSWFDIYAQIFNVVIFGKGGRGSKGHIITDLIWDNEAISQRICDELDLTIIDLRIEYGDVVFPAGIPSIDVVDEDYQCIGKLTEHPKLEGVYVAHAAWFDDCYSAALSFLDPAAVQAAQERIEAGRQLLELVPDYI